MSPNHQPIGPKTTCAAKIVGNKENNGTKIIEIASGICFLKKISKYANIKPANIAGITCAW